MSSISNREIMLGSICGIPIHVHTYYFLLILITIISNIHVFMEFPSYLLFHVILYGPVMMFTAISHGLGHCLMHEKLGGNAEKIVMYPLISCTHLSPLYDAGVIGEMKVALAGSLTHILQMVMWFVFFAIFARGNFQYFQYKVYSDILSTGFTGFVSTLCSNAFYLNGCALVFNFLIPVYPMDGGRFMAGSLILCGMPMIRAAMITSITSMLYANCLLSWGVYTYFWESNQFPVYTILIALYIFIAGTKLYVMAKSGRADQHPLFNKYCYVDGVSTIEEEEEDAELTYVTAVKAIAVTMNTDEKSKAIMKLDREKLALEREEKRLMMEIKKNAKAGQMKSVKNMAKDLVRTHQDLVRTRIFMTKMIETKSHLQGLSHAINKTSNDENE